MMRKFLVLGIMLIGLVFPLQAIKINRTVFPNQIKAGGEIIVSVAVNKEGIEGFARLIENVPKGFRAEELNSATGNFIFENGKIRIIWLTMPEGDTFKAEYRLVHVGSNTGLIKLDGKFHYVKNDKRLEISLPIFDLTVKKVSTPKEIVRLEKAIETIDTTETVLVDKVDIVKTDVVDKVDIAKTDVVDKVDIAKADVVDKVETEKTEAVDKVSTAETVVVDKLESTDSIVVDKVDYQEEEIIDVNSELFFKIQLGAYSIEKPSTVFGNLPDIHYIKIGNVFKYYSGKFTNEADARAIIPQAKAKGFKGAFLVRFKNGKRI